MKGIIFTVDSIFALIIAVASLSILLYFYYLPSTPYTIRYSEASSIMNELASTSVSSIANSSQIAASIVYQSAASNETWPQFMNNAANNAGNAHGPMLPYTSFIFKSASSLTTGIVADYGNIYFASGNIIYALNASTGALKWSKNVQTSVTKTPALYNNMLIFANSSNLTALNAGNGMLVWSTNALTTIGYLTSPVKVYNGKVLFGATNNYLYAFDSENGTMAWSNYTGNMPTSISAVSGSIALRSSSNIKMLIVTGGGTAKQLWSYPYAVTTTNLTTYSGIIVTGAGSNVNGTYVDDSPAFSYPAGSSLVGVSAYGGYIAFQGATTDGLLSSSGSPLWAVPMPSSLGTAVPGAYPVVSDNLMYTLWLGGYVVAQNISNGNIAWVAPLPLQLYGIQMLPYMTLAYGRLYVAVGSYVIAFGACSASANGTLLSSAASMYLNGEGGCATALADKLYQMSNYSIFLNNNFAPGMHVATFNGANSKILLGSYPNLMSYYYTWSLWLNASSWSANTVIIGQNATTAGSPLMIETSNATSPYRLEFTIDNGAVGDTVYAPVSLNKWENIAVTYASVLHGQSLLSIYVNGNLVSYAKNTSMSRYNGMISLGNSPAYSSLYFNGKMAGVEIYNKSLSASQVMQIYLSGMAAAPVTYGAAGWWPLEGDANDYNPYAVVPDTGYPININYGSAGYIPSGMLNAFEIAKSSAPVALANSTSGLSNLYSIGVYAWR